MPPFAFAPDMKKAFHTPAKRIDWQAEAWRMHAKAPEFTIWQAIRHCITDKYASGSGRAGRGEFFSYFLSFILFCLFWSLFVLAGIDYFGDVNLLDFVLMYVPFLFFPPLVAVTVRRLHDAGKTGWLMIIFFIPILNFFGFALVLMRGEPGWNRFGPPPARVDF